MQKRKKKKCDRVSHFLREYRPKPETTTGEIIVPPVDDLTMLIEYAKKGQIKGIQKELEKISQMNDNYKPFVNHLNQLVKSFNIKKIRQFLQNHIK
jgi:hypothetical protein